MLWLQTNLGTITLKSRFRIILSVPSCTTVLQIYWSFTPARTKISSLEIDIFGLKMMVKSGLEFFILKFTEPLQRYLLTCQANSAFLGRFFCTGQQQLWRGSMNFKIKNSRPLFIIICKPKMSIWRLEILVYLKN